MAGDLFVVNAEAAIYRDGSYLLAERTASEDHAAGQLSLVGGTVEADAPGSDTLEATVRREVREEVGLAVGAVEYVTISHFETDDGTQCLNTVFLARSESGTATTREPGEVASVEWVPVDDIADNPDIPPFTRHYLEAVNERRNGLGW